MQGDAAGGDRAAEIDFDEPVGRIVCRVGCPAGQWVAIDDLSCVAEVGSGAADAAAEVVGVAGGVDVFLNADGL